MDLNNNEIALISIVVILQALNIFFENFRQGQSYVIYASFSPFLRTLYFPFYVLIDVLNLNINILNLILINELLVLIYNSFFSYSDEKDARGIENYHVSLSKCFLFCLQSIFFILITGLPRLIFHDEIELISTYFLISSLILLPINLITNTYITSFQVKLRKMRISTNIFVDKTFYAVLVFCFISIVFLYLFFEFIEIISTNQFSNAISNFSITWILLFSLSFYIFRIVIYVKYLNSNDLLVTFFHILPVMITLLILNIFPTNLDTMINSITFSLTGSVILVILYDYFKLKSNNNTPIS